MARRSFSLFLLVVLGLSATARAIRTDINSIDEASTQELAFEALGVTQEQAAEEEEEEGDRQLCHETVHNAVSRNCRSRLFGLSNYAYGCWSKKCKCNKYSEIAGDNQACKDARAAGRKFSADELKGKGCYCKLKSNYEVPLKDMRPHFDCVTESSSIREFVEQAREWCKSDKMDPDVRIPEKMRGLYWLYGLGIQNMAFCTSLAEWNKKTLVMTLAVWTHFTFFKGPTVNFDGKQVAKMAYDDAYFKLKINQGPMLYEMTFNSTDMTYATIVPNSWAFSAAMDFTLVELDQTPDGLVQSTEPGDIYDRPCYLVAKKKFLDIFHYQAVRVLYDNGTINEANLKLMEEKEKTLFEQSGSKIVRYAQTC